MLACTILDTSFGNMSQGRNVGLVTRWDVLRIWPSNSSANVDLVPNRIPFDSRDGGSRGPTIWPPLVSFPG